MNIDKEFVPYTESLELKELGFDDPCLAINNGDKLFYGAFKSTHAYYKEYAVILYQQAFRWFREKHNWQNSIDPTADQYNHQLGYNYWIWNYKTGEEHHTMPKNRPTGDWEYETYEEAELACLKKLIELVKNK